MKWPVLLGKRRIQPAVGDYQDWKPNVAADCDSRCVYCTVREAENGGIDNFHIDHFRPKSRFTGLRKSIENLFLSCAICNRFKSDDWPTEPVADHSHAGYIDPAQADYNQLLSVDSMTFRISAKSAAGRYTIERLYLNRPQMIRQWRARFLAKRIGEFEDYARLLLAEARKTTKVQVNRLACQFADEVIAVAKTYREASELPPYQYGEIRRPAVNKPKKSGLKPRKKR